MVTEKQEKSSSKASLPEQVKGLFGALDRSRSKYIEAVTQAQRDRRTRIGKAWSAYTTETSAICTKGFKVWIDTYNNYLAVFAKLPAQPDEKALQLVQSAWAEHLAACQSPETTKTMIDAEHKLVEALGEADKEYADAEQSAVNAYSESVESALSAHGLAKLDVAQAQFVASEIVMRSTALTAETA